MYLLIAETKPQRRAFVNFIYEVYRGNACFRDNLSANCKNFLYKHDAFTRSCNTRPLLVYSGNRIVARTMLIYHSGLDAVQMGFFEALPGQYPAVDMLMEAAKAFAAQLGLTKILAGINGHTSYGVGFLLNAYDKPNPFDGGYSQPYYPAYFERLGFKAHGFSTYYMHLADFKPGPRILERIYAEFTFREINLKNLKHEMQILGGLFNQTLADTPFFFPKSPAEWYDVFKTLRPILKNENIIYVLKDKREVGYLFWHPNYNQLINKNKNSALNLVIKLILHKKRLSEIKINALGVLPQHFASGAVIGLFNELTRRTITRFSGGETGFISDANTRSKIITQRYCGKPFRQYALYELELSHDA